MNWIPLSLAQRWVWRSIDERAGSAAEELSQHIAGLRRLTVPQLAIVWKVLDESEDTKNRANLCLLKALIAGDVKATGVPEGQVGGRPIAPDDWARLELVRFDKDYLQLTTGCYREVLLFTEDVSLLRSSLSPETLAAPTNIAPGKRGPKPRVGPRVLAEMRSYGVQNLENWTEEALVAQFRASREICRNARNTLRSEIVANSFSDK